MDLQGLKVFQVSMVLTEQMAQLGHKDRKGLSDLQDRKGHRDHKVHKGLLETQGLKDQLELMELMVLTEQMVQ